LSDHSHTEIQLFQCYTSLIFGCGLLNATHHSDLAAFWILHLTHIYIHLFECYTWLIKWSSFLNVIHDLHLRIAFSMLDITHIYIQLFQCYTWLTCRSSFFNAIHHLPNQNVFRKSITCRYPNDYQMEIDPTN
jgi:hypothetical protein